MQVTFRRHFESVANTRGPSTDALPLAERMRIQHAGELTTSGQEQAVAEQLVAPAANLVFSSAMRRAHHSAQLVYPTMPVQIDARLNEQNYGALTMLSKPAIARDYAEHIIAKAEQPFAWQPPQGESFLQMCDRLDEFMTEVATLQVDTIECFTHETAILAIRSLTNNPPMSELVAHAKANPMPYGYAYTVEL